MRHSRVVVNADDEGLVFNTQARIVGTPLDKRSPWIVGKARAECLVKGRSDRRAVLIGIEKRQVIPGVGLVVADRESSTKGTDGKRLPVLRQQDLANLNLNLGPATGGQPIGFAQPAQGGVEQRRIPQTPTELVQASAKRQVLFR